MQPDPAIKNVLVTGSEGYIGSVLCPILIHAGYQVTGLDIGWFSDGQLIPHSRRINVLPLDIRDVEPEHLRSYDAIVHLAGLSNDPLGALDEEITYAINHRATVRLAEIARSVGVKRFINSSSCSIYGAAGETELDESATMAPQTAYAKSKVMAERDLDTLSSEQFAVTHLRNGTAFGISPRQRFDIVLPNLAGTAQVYGEILLTSDGTPWRPLVHISDIAQAAGCCLRAPAEVVAGKAYNIGMRGANYQIRDVAEAVHRAFPECQVNLGEQSGPDRRTYKVSFERIHHDLPDFKPKWTLQEGADECARIFAILDLDEDMFTDPRYTRLSRIQQLRKQGILNENLRFVQAELFAS